MVAATIADRRSSGGSAVARRVLGVAAVDIDYRE
jgi:hypothetical protein